MLRVRRVGHGEKTPLTQVDWTRMASPAAALLSPPAEGLQP